MSSVIDSVLSFANSHIGDKYSQANRFGANTFDCSSFVYRAFESAGITLTHMDTGAVVNVSSEEVYAKNFTLLYPTSYTKIGKNLPSPTDTLTTIGAQAGDLVFYNTTATDRANKITHVSIVNNTGKLIHALNPSSGVCQSRITLHSDEICAVIRYNGAGQTTTVSEATEKSKPITDVVVKSITGSGGSSRVTYNAATNSSRSVEVFIVSDHKIYSPLVLDDVVWETERRGAPGKLTFTVVKDDEISFLEGDTVMLKIAGENIFYGFVFEKTRDRDHHIEVVAYDQLRYFKNKDAYIYKNKKASELIAMIAGDFNLKAGSLADTGYVIPQRVEDNSTLFDTVQNALDDTLTNKGILYILYDDYGTLSLKSAPDMKLDFLLNNQNAQNFDYTSSIDDCTYDKIKLVYDNDKTGEREVYIAQDSDNIGRWGVLQNCDNLQENENGKVKADTLLKLYNAKTRRLTAKGVFGDVRVRAGSSIWVQLNLGDIILSEYMMVGSAKHKYSNDDYTMDLTLTGGEFGS